jgi:membrane-bound serine protease (ClpP class)
MDADILINPNFAYLLLVIGISLGMFAIFTPGTGFLEAAALITLVLAGWMVINLPINWWALLILVIGVFPFLLALRFTYKKIYLIISIVSVVIGSIFLFDAPGWELAVNPFLAIVVSTLVVVFYWVAATKTLQAAQMRPVQDMSALIGMIGEARTDIEGEGSVYVNGELWSARSVQPIRSGASIRVVERQGLTLIVEPA